MASEDLELTATEFIARRTAEQEAQALALGNGVIQLRLCQIELAGWIERPDLPEDFYYELRLRHNYVFEAMAAIDKQREIVNASE